MKIMKPERNSIAVAEGESNQHIIQKGESISFSIFIASKTAIGSP